MLIVNRVGTYVGRYLPDASQVAIGEDYYDILAETDEYIALFKPGRSVYKSGQGSEYEPARNFFCRFNKRDSLREYRGEQVIEIDVLLDTPIRRR